MDIVELRELLDAVPVPPDAVVLLGDTPDEAYVLDRDGTGWVVFYAERGLRTEERRYPSEDEACRDLYTRATRAFPGQRPAGP